MPKPIDNQEPSEEANDDIRTPAQDPIELEEGDNEERDVSEGPSELDVLKIRAKTLGVTHSPNIGVDTLRAKIDEHIEKMEEKRIPEITRESAPVVEAPLARPNTVTVNRNTLPPMSTMLAMTTEDLLRQPVKKRTQIIRARQQHQQLALVRCQIYNNNPAKNDLHGEIFSVQNKYLGVVRKFIPYGEYTENGFHIPRILLNMLRAKKYLQVRAIRNPDGTERTEQRQAPEFTINELRPLNTDELKQLAAMQAARASNDAGFVGLS